MPDSIGVRLDDDGTVRLYHDEHVGWRTPDDLPT